MVLSVSPLNAPISRKVPPRNGTAPELSTKKVRTCAQGCTRRLHDQLPPSANPPTRHHHLVLGSLTETARHASWSSAGLRAYAAD